MVLIQILPGDTYHPSGNSYASDHQQLQENLSCNGSSTTQNPICDHGRLVLQRRLDPMDDNAKGCSGSSSNYYNDTKMCTTNNNGANENLSQIEAGLGTVMIANVHKLDENKMVEENTEMVLVMKTGCMNVDFSFNAHGHNGKLCAEKVDGGKKKCHLGLTGKGEGYGQNKDSGVLLEKAIYCKGGRNDTCENVDLCKNDLDDEGYKMVEGERRNDRKDDVPQVIVIDEEARPLDDVVDEDDDIDEDEDDHDDDGIVGNSSCRDDDDEIEYLLETDYNSDVSSIGSDQEQCSLDDVEDNDDDDEDDDMSISISDIDVQSFFAQLDEGIASSENTNPAIDSGYAWIVVFAVFLIQTILLGYLKSGGIFFVEVQRQYQSSASMTSLIIGLVEAIFSISAPIVLGFLVKIWSVRQLCLVGSLVFVISVVGNAVSDNVEYLLLTHSVCFGAANGLIYGPSIYIINEYFHKRKALAMSIATTGASCGGVIFPLLVRLLFDSYGYTGGSIMIAGIIMQIFIGSVLLIPVNHHDKSNNNNNNNNKLDYHHNKDVETNGVGPNALTKKEKLGFLDSLKQRWNSSRNGKGDSNSESKFKISNINKSSSSIYQKNQNNVLHNSQHKFLGTNVKPLQLEQFSSKLEICEEGVPLEIQSEYHTTAGDANTNTNKAEPTKDSINDKKPSQLTINGRFAHILSDNTSISSTQSHLSGSICSSAHPGSSRHRLDVLHNGCNPNELGVFPSHASSLLLMSKVSTSKQTLSRSIMFQSTSTINNTIADIISIDQDMRRLSRMQSPVDENRNVSTFRRLIPRFCDSPLLKSASFWILVPYYFSAAIGVGLSQIYLLPFAKERGLTDDQATFCLSLLNMLDIIAHLAPGIILNFGFMTSTSVAILPMAIVGIVGHLTPFFHTYASILGMSVAYGLSMGFFYSLHSLIAIDTLGLENYSSSIGIYYLVCGMAGAVSYPAAGALKDYSGSYTTTFHYLASMQFVAVAILVVLPAVKRFDVRRGVLKAT